MIALVISFGFINKSTAIRPWWPWIVTDKIIIGDQQIPIDFSCFRPDRGGRCSISHCALHAAGRQAGSRATGVLRFSRPTRAQSDIKIPAGTICAAISDSGGLIEFQTDEAVVLAASAMSAYIEATAIVAGIAGNVSMGAISIIRTPVMGISSCTNDAAFSGGTDQESDTDLRERDLYTIWVNGRATIPLMEQHIDAIAGVREARVETLGQGDALIVIDAEDELINDIDEMVLDNLVAGCTAPGVLGASIRYGASSFEIGDCSGLRFGFETCSQSLDLVRR